MRIVKEFKEFALRGNVIDLAVGIIIGAEFGKIVNSLVNDILMPPIGMLIGGVNFTDLYFPLDGNTYSSFAKAREAGAPLFAYGNFIQAVINFIIVASAIFMLIKLMNRLKREESKS